MRFVDTSAWLLMACIPCVGLVGGSVSRGAESSSRILGHWVGTVCPTDDEECEEGPTVHVVVKATPGQTGDILRYQWRATDGAVFDHNLPSTTWRLPPGPGLHFVYVLVSNGKGGYDERRAAVNTDTIGTPLHPRPSGKRYLAPPAPRVTTGAYRSYALVANVPFAIVSTDPTIQFRSQTVLSGVRDRFSISGIPPSAWNHLDLDAAGVASPLSYANIDLPFSDSLGVYYPDQVPLSVSFDSDAAASDPHHGPSGNVILKLADGSPCGTVNEFFGVEVTATVSAVVNGVPTGVIHSDVNGNILLPDPLPQPSVGDVAAVTAKCQSATFPFSFRYYIDSFNGPFVTSIPPKVNAINVTVNGRTVPSLQPDDSGFPSHPLQSRDAFFTEMGLDSRLGACRYYEAIGVGKCDVRTQTLNNAINFEDWKRATGMAPYVLEGHHEVTAAFVNRMDLNLARNHHSISYGPDHTAAYVCNGKGPPFAAVDGDADVTTAVADAVAGRNRIACVAMDYMSTPEVNGGAPFTRFIIFGPDGRVLPSINLDGRAEKFVPGVCVACHGGSNYAGHFPEDGTGLPDLAAHFLPYDAGNFLFSSAEGFRKEDQEAAIKALNLIVLNGAGPTDGEVNLILGWYGQDLSAPELDRNYIPPHWDIQEADLTGPIHQTYHQIIAPMCRTCHAALPERFNLDDYYNLRDDAQNNPNPTYPIDPQLIHTHSVCEFYQTMPNSLVTFNRFWTTHATENDLSKLFLSFLAANGRQTSSPCDPP
jgi:hypothetical protein